MKKAVFPGSFDPITIGHIDVIKRALKLFDQITIGVADRKEKSPIFSLNEREELVKKVTAKIKRVKVKVDSCGAAQRPDCDVIDSAICGYPIQPFPRDLIAILRVIGESNQIPILVEEQ